MISSLIFDLNGVIITEGDEVRDQLVSQGFAMENLDKVINGRQGACAQFVRGEIGYDAYIEEVKKVFPDTWEFVIEAYQKRRLLSIDPEKFTQKIVQPFNLTFPQEEIAYNSSINVLDLIAALSKSYPLCLFTGSTPLNIEVQDREYHFLQYFTYKVFSYDAKADKPDMRMFSFLKETIPYSPDECIYIDDMEENIQRGNELGYHGVVMAEIQ